MNRKLLSLSVILIAVLTLAIACGDAEAGCRHRNRCQQNVYGAVQQPYYGGAQQAYVAPYTPYVGSPVQYAPSRGGTNCNCQNNGYQSQAYKGIVTRLP